MNEETCEVPLYEQLRRVPKNHRLEIEHSPTSHSMIPVGVLCHKAADKLEKIHREEIENKKKRKIFQESFTKPTPNDHMCKCGYSKGEHSKNDLYCPLVRGLQFSTYDWNGKIKDDANKEINKSLQATPKPPQITETEELLRHKKWLKDLELSVNCNNKENGSNTPDFIIAEYLNDCLEALNKAVNARSKWYGHECSISGCKYTGEIKPTKTSSNLPTSNPPDAKLDTQKINKAYLDCFEIEHLNNQVGELQSQLRTAKEEILKLNKMKEPPTTILNESLYDKSIEQKALDLCYLIEGIPASIEQTRASIVASDLHQHLITYLKNSRSEIEYQRDRVKELKAFLADNAVENREFCKRLEASKREASCLAKSLYEQHYQKENPTWKMQNDTVGILLQISNMVSGMERIKEPICKSCKHKNFACRLLKGTTTCDYYTKEVDLKKMEKDINEFVYDRSSWENRKAEERKIKEAKVFSDFNDSPWAWAKKRSEERANKKLEETKLATCACKRLDCSACNPKSKPRPMFDCCDSQSEPLKEVIASGNCYLGDPTRYETAINCLKRIRDGHIVVLPRHEAEKCLELLDAMAQLELPYNTPATKGSVIETKCKGCCDSNFNPINCRGPYLHWVEIPDDIRVDKHDWNCKNKQCNHATNPFYHSHCDICNTPRKE